MHEALLVEGFVGLLKAFLEVLPTNKLGKDGEPMLTLPNVTVRVAVYRALKELPINTLDASSRHMLKSSGIGPVLKFYSKVADETPENRRLVSDILQSWMAPMVEEGRKAMMSNEVEDARRQVR
jgi:TFIIS helical bundle-like domain